MRTLLVSFALLAACGRGDRSPPSASPTPTATPPSTPTPGTTPAVVSDAAPAFPGTLSAPVSVRSSIELKAQLTITNPGPGELAVRRGAVDLAMLALEVRDVAGRRVNPIPPPVPRPEDADVLTLRPGESLVRDYPLHIYSPALPAGTYTLNCLVVACAPHTFTVAP